MKDFIIPKHILERAKVDSTLRRNLFVCRNDKVLLQRVVEKYQAHPENLKEEDLSSLHILGNFSKAMVQWAADGFAKVDDEVYQKRLSICISCPHLVKQPNRFTLVNLVANRSESICSLCGCPIRRKAALPSETCPSAKAG